MKPGNDTTPRIELRPYEVTVPTADGQSVACKVSLMVPMEWDETIDEWLLTPDAMLEIENTKVRHMGLLLPDEIRALREKLDMTQAEMAELLKIGGKTWTRWETGTQRPSQSLNLLLKALQAALLTPYMLKQLDAPQIDWTEAVAATEASELQPATMELDLPDIAETPVCAGNYEEMPLAA